MTLPSFVKIVEVGPRDGLQAEPEALSIEDRITFIDLLSQTGLKAIEVGSFVSPKWIPQLADSDKVYQGMTKNPDIDYSFLVPNRQGFDKALENNVRSIAVFTAASETFCQKNINASIAESFTNFASFVPQAKAKGMRVRGYVSTAIACPFEGPIPPARVHEVVTQLLKIGCDEISLGDTIGVGTPLQVQELLKNIPAPLDKLAVHFHDTYGQGVVNIYAALEKGISIVDSSVSGLGGCPYAPGASGNVASEDVVYMLNGLDIKSDVDLNVLLKAAKFIDGKLGRVTASRASYAMRSRV